MDLMSAHAIVTTTVDSEEAAERVAGAVLDRRLAACVQSHAIVSRYVWRGERRRDPEILLQMKIKGEDWEDCAAAIREVHPYDTPEIVRVDIADADPRYAAWIGETTR
jgi:periplasmic divalent cation tolerance protein